MGFTLRDVSQALQGFSRSGNYKEMRAKERELYQQKLRAERQRQYIQNQYQQAQDTRQIRNPLLAGPNNPAQTPFMLPTVATPKPSGIPPVQSPMGAMSLAPNAAPTGKAFTGETVPTTISAPKYNQQSVENILEALVEARKRAHQSSDQWSDYKKANF